ncbi:sulfotransferase [Lentibacillus jeotgali]|uniref:sulfotransferase n=1 Tax=Lentibacillus jeotgali TaxID=558169 RepID=UPI0002628B96|nr:sulfotransferase [Lentibacillus jeotgali]
MTKPVFIISTGRSGSTAISNCINLHPNILSLSEFFLSIHINDSGSSVEKNHWPGLSLEIWDGKQFWDFLSKKEPIHLGPYINKGMQVKEMLYQVSDTSQFNMETGIPGMLLMTLPHLTEYPDQLFEELESVVTQFPEDRLDRQYRRLFNWLLNRFERDVCVERSGLSVNFTDRLVQMFPDAKFIFLYRDVRETAMAFNRFQPVKLDKALKKAREITGEDPANPNSDISRLGEFKWLHPDYFEVEKLKQFEMPYDVLGENLSSSLVSAAENLAKLPSEQVLYLCYETLMETPQDQLRRVIQFIQPASSNPEENERWVERSASMIRPKPDTWTELPPEKRKQLEKASEPALKLLEYV